MAIEKKNKAKKSKEVIREAQIEAVDKREKNGKIGMGITFAILVLLLIAGVYWGMNPKESSLKTDAVKFKEEYEQYNNKNDEQNKKEYPELKLSEKNIMTYSSYEEIFELLDGKSGVVYLGFPTCPWCRNLVPVLLEAAEEAGVDTIHYLDASSSRDIKKRKDGKIVTEKEGSKDYYKLIEKLNDVLGVYEGLEDDSIKRLYFPTVLFIKDGKVSDVQIGTVDSQKDAYTDLTTEQSNELKQMLVEKMNKMLSCDSTC